MSEDEGAALTVRVLRLPARRDRYAELVDAVHAFGHDTEIENRLEWHEFMTAVSEIGANILIYAYKGCETEEVELKLVQYGDRIEARFRDWGAPFVEQPTIAPSDNDDSDYSVFALEERGRGLAIARIALNAVEYDRSPDGTNRWRLVKRL